MKRHFRVPPAGRNRARKIDQLSGRQQRESLAARDRREKLAARDRREWPTTRDGREKLASAR